MADKDFTTTILVHKKPEEVFDLINDIKGWWTEDFKGNSRSLHDEFEVRFGDVHYSKQKLVEVEPGKKVVWQVLDSDLSFLEDRDEWNGTNIRFDITPKGDKTEVKLTHAGLVPEIECYDSCSSAWGQYMQYSLQSYIDAGKGQPGFPPEGPVT